MSWTKGPVYWIEDRVLYISIPFTWNLPDVRSFLLQKSFMWDRAVVGGPAVYLMPEFFTDLQHVRIGRSMPGVLQLANPQATRTTAGCPNKCGFCGVKRINGDFVELEDWPDLPVLIDDNIFAASQQHFDKVIDRLSKHLTPITKKSHTVDFNQGVDSRLLSEYHAERIARLKKPMIRLALDSMAYADEWLKAVDLLRSAGVAKSNIRSYALVGFNSDPAEAWERCEFIEKHVDKVLPMWFHPLDALKSNQVTLTQKSFGWSKFERRKLMEWYYKHKRLQAGVTKPCTRQNPPRKVAVRSSLVQGGFCW
jgi:hypothetical protein